MKNVILFFLAFSLIPAPITYPPIEIEENFARDGAPEVDGYGQRFNILYQTKEGALTDMDAAERSADLVKDSLYWRSVKVEDRFNVEFTAEGREDALRWMRNAVLAACDDYAAVSLPVSDLGQAMTEGFFYDLSEIPTIEVDERWWLPSMREALIFGDEGTYFALPSDISPANFDAVHAMTFDRTLVDENEVYNLARGGKWTVDELMRLTKELPVSLNGRAASSAAALTAAAGEEIIEKTRTTLTLKGLSASLMDLSDKLAGHLADDAEGAAFEVSTVGEWSMSGESDRYGILPLPKGDEADEYSSPVTRDFPLIAMPVTNRDPDFAGLVLDELAYASTKILVRPLYESRQDAIERIHADREMMKLIRDGRTLDVSSAFGWIDRMQASLAKGLTDGNLASEWAMAAGLTQKQLDDGIGRMLEIVGYR